MDIKDFLKKIPNDVRSQILFGPDEPLIKATPTTSCNLMRKLAVVWWEYLAPDEEKEWNCPMCMQYIHNMYKSFYDVLVEIEKENQLLNSI